MALYDDERTRSGSVSFETSVAQNIPIRVRSYSILSLACRSFVVVMSIERITLDLLIPDTLEEEVPHDDKDEESWFPKEMKTRPDSSLLWKTINVVRDYGAIGDGVTYDTVAELALSLSMGKELQWENKRSARADCVIHHGCWSDVWYCAFDPGQAVPSSKTECPNKANEPWFIACRDTGRR